MVEHTLGGVLPGTLYMLILMLIDHPLIFLISFFLIYKMFYSQQYCRNGICSIAHYPYGEHPCTTARGEDQCRADVGGVAVERRCWLSRAKNSTGNICQFHATLTIPYQPYTQSCSGDADAACARLSQSHDHNQTFLFMHPGDSVVYSSFPYILPLGGALSFWCWCNCILFSPMFCTVPLK